MALILAIETDRQQARHLHATLRARVGAELVIAESADVAADKLRGRVPDLILTSALVSPKDDAAIAQWLRGLGPNAAHVQTLTVPILAASHNGSTGRAGVLSALKRERPLSLVENGCDPAVFAEQVAMYLERAASEPVAEGHTNTGRADATLEHSCARVDPTQPHVASLLDRLQALAEQADQGA